LTKVTSSLLFKQGPDEAKFKEAIAALEAKLDVYEKILSGQKYLAGDVSIVSRL
jgi:glutathione S-transferase